MAIGFHESASILQQFKAQFRWIRVDHNIHGLGVVFSGTDVVLQIRVRSLAGTPDLPANFGYSFEKKINLTLPVAVVECSPPRLKTAHSTNTKDTVKDSLVRVGDQAEADGGTGWGTAGWMFYLKDSEGKKVLVCLSNWHVLCAKGNDSAVGIQRCLLQGRNIATLYAFEPISQNNVWDYALAKLDNVADATAEMEFCADHTQFAYPDQLTPVDKPTTGTMCHKVGRRTGCTQGKLVSLSYDTQIEGEGWFTGQLAFEVMSKAGDSGSTIIYGDDNSVLGVLFAGADEPGPNNLDFANPIFRAPWHLVGWERTERGLRMPVLEGPAILTPYGKSAARRTNAYRLPAEGDRLSSPASLMRGTRLFDFPTVGTGYSVLKIGAWSYRVLGPADGPPPIPADQQYFELSWTSPDPDDHDSWASITYIILLKRTDPRGKLFKRVERGRGGMYNVNGLAIDLCDQTDPGGMARQGVSYQACGRWVGGLPPPPNTGVPISSAVTGRRVEFDDSGFTYYKDAILYWGK